MSTKGLKQLRERRNEIIKKWEDAGILDGLTPMKDGNLAGQFQGETSYKFPEDGPFQGEPQGNSDILPIARRVVNQMNKLEKCNDCGHKNEEICNTCPDLDCGIYETKK